MTAPRHTPGPWSFDGSIDHDGRADVTYRDQQNFSWDIAWCRPCPGPGAETAEGNAHLIAAAPELYEALYKCREWVQLATDHPAAEPGVYEALGALDAALAKARGDASC